MWFYSSFNNITIFSCVSCEQKEISEILYVLVLGNKFGVPDRILFVSNSFK